MTDDPNELTGYQIIWCIAMCLALGTAAMDVAVWRKKPEPEQICKRTDFSQTWRRW